MKLQIIYENNTSSLIEALIYLLPNKENVIFDIVLNLHYSNSIYINDNYIYTKIKNTDDYLKISDKLFIKCMLILKECTENTFAINIDSEKDYHILQQYYKKTFYNEDYFDKKNNLKLIINEEIYVITSDIFNELFNFKLINSNNFIRLNKLKKIL